MSNIDRLVAEKVMGWHMHTWKEWGHKDREGFTGWWASADGKTTQRSEACDDYYEPENAWSPSTDMNAAMEVAAKVVSELPPEFSSSESFSLQKWNDWEAYFGYSREEESHRGIAHHANPATAICLAALAAVGVEYKESKDE